MPIIHNLGFISGYGVAFCSHVIETRWKSDFTNVHKDSVLITVAGYWTTIG